MSATMMEMLNKIWRENVLNDSNGLYNERNNLIISTWIDVN